MRTEVAVVDLGIRALKIQGAEIDVYVQDCSPLPVYVEAFDTNDRLLLLPEEVSIGLSSDNGATFYTDSSCSSPTQVARIGKGDSVSEPIYLKSSKSGSVSVLASAGPYGQNKSASFTFRAHSPDTLRLRLSGPEFVAVGVCSSGFQIRLEDLRGNESRVQSATPVALRTGTSLVGKLFMDSACTTPATALAIPPGEFASPSYFARNQASEIIEANIEALSGNYLPAKTKIHFQIPGEMDSSFNGQGKITPPGPTWEQIQALAPYKEEKALAAGEIHNGANFDFAVSVHNKDGTTDASFGAEGRAIFDLSTRDDFATEVAALSSGKILVAGHSRAQNEKFDFSIIRLHSNGVVDEKFGTSGKTLVDFSGQNDQVRAMLVQPDNKIVLGGLAYVANGGFSQIALARFNADGTLDTGFGSNGKVTLTVNRGFNASASALLMQDIKIIVAGTAYNQVTVGTTTTFGSEFVLIRLNENGSLDPSFGANGQVLSQFGGENVLTSAVKSADQSLILGGTTFVAGTKRSHFILARYSGQGVLDTAFGASGRTIINFSNRDSHLSSLAIQEDNKIIAAGYAYGGPVDSHDIAVARYLATTGAPDTTFNAGGTAGRKTVDVRSTADGATSDEAHAVMVAPAGNIWIGGSSIASRSSTSASSTSQFDFQLVRILR